MSWKCSYRWKLFSICAPESKICLRFLEIWTDLDSMCLTAHEDMLRCFRSAVFELHFLLHKRKINKSIVNITIKLNATNKPKAVGAESARTATSSWIFKCLKPSESLKITLVQKHTKEFQFRVNKSCLRSLCVWVSVCL